MKIFLPAAIAAVAVTLAACERPASTSSTTVVQPTKEKETIVQRDVPVAPTPPASTSSTTIINPPAPNVTIDASKPDTTTTERSRSTTTVDTPMGTATKTETSKTVTK